MSIKTARWGQSKGSARPILQDTAEASAKSLSKHHGHPNRSREVKSYHRMVSEQHLQLATHPALGCSVNISVTSYTPRLESQCERQCDKLHTSPWSAVRLSVSQTTHPTLGLSATVSVTNYTPRPGLQCNCQCHKLHRSALVYFTPLTMLYLWTKIKK